MQNIPSGELGQTHIDEFDAETATLLALYAVLFKAWKGGFSTRSRFSRSEADMVAVAATELLITTKLSEEMWGNQWLITEDGLQYMKELEDALS